VELKDEHQSVTLPDWAGQEVTGDPRYYNANLVAKTSPSGENEARGHIHIRQFVKGKSLGDL